MTVKQKKKPQQQFYIENQVERKILEQDASQLEFVPDRRVIIRNPSDYTHSSQMDNSSETTVKNTDDSDFEQYFGFKMGEKVDSHHHLHEAHLSKNFEKTAEEQSKSQIKKLPFEEQIAYKEHKDKRIKPPTVSNEPIKPILKHHDLSDTTRTRSSLKKYDFRKLGNAHIYAEKPTNVEYKLSKAEEKRELSHYQIPASYSRKVDIPDSVVKPILDHRTQLRSRNQVKIGVNNTLSYSCGQNTKLPDVYNTYDHTTVEKSGAK